MCGIAGIIGDRGLTVVGGPIHRMLDSVPYRGPDGRGIALFTDDNVALGHVRLSIIDPKPSGNQPMATADGRYHITFNGEIYNYREIRGDLQSRGYHFISQSDTEVLLTSYVVWGERCLERFIGMFAFAIWDAQEKILFAARDRMGVKPFYYLCDGHTLIFASEIKSILAVQSFSQELDHTLVDAYMSFGYVPGEATLFPGILRLLPGHSLTWRDNRLMVGPYWDFDFNNQVDKGVCATAGDVEGLLRDSIDLRLRSDVPLGVFLSGGLDSSTVVSMLAPGAAAGLKTFSISYAFGADYDETPHARRVAKTFNTDHHELVITPKDFLDFIPKFVWHMDEPVTEAAAISLYYVAKLAREHVIVCLSGEGSDEIFAGYDLYAYNVAIEQLRSLLGAGVLRGAAAAGQALSLPRKLLKYLNLAHKSLPERYKGIGGHDEATKQRLYSKDFAASSRSGSLMVQKFINGLFERSRDWDPLSRMLYLDSKTWLVDDLLIKADRMSMAASIELRVPFLDHRLVEYVASVPSRYKMKRWNPKYILKQVAGNRLPASIINRKKMGFPTPLEIMFKGDLYNYARDILLSQQASQRGYFNPAAVKNMLEDHYHGRQKNHREIWQLLVLEEWHRQFNGVDGSSIIGRENI